MPKTKYYKAFPAVRTQSAADITRALRQRDAGEPKTAASGTDAVAASAAPSAPGPAESTPPDPVTYSGDFAEGHQA